MSAMIEKIKEEYLKTSSFTARNSLSQIALISKIIPVAFRYLMRSLEFSKALNQNAIIAPEQSLKTSLSRQILNHLMLYTQEVTGSNPVLPTRKVKASDFQISMTHCLRQEVIVF